MKRYFGNVHNGGPILPPQRYWFWDEDTQRGFWCDANGTNIEASVFKLDSWDPRHFKEIPRPLAMDSDMSVDEGL